MRVDCVDARCVLGRSRAMKPLFIVGKSLELEEVPSGLLDDVVLVLCEERLSLTRLVCLLRNTKTEFFNDNGVGRDVQFFITSGFPSLLSSRSQTLKSIG